MDLNRNPRIMNNIETSYYLPHRFKFIGWGLILLHLLVIVVLILLVDILQVLSVSNISYGHVIVYLFKYTIMIGLAMVISSREKQEDEMIRLIRLKSFQYGLYFAVFISILFPFLKVFLMEIDVMIDGFWIYPSALLTGLDTISAILLYIVVIYQFKLYRLRSDEE